MNEEVLMPALALLLLLAAEPAVTPAAAADQLPAPVYATSGYTKPAEVQRGCVGSSVRFPVALGGFSGPVSTRFAVELDGSTSRFEALSDTPEQVAAAIAQAVKGCRFTPGRDPKGAPVVAWLILPLRFEAAAPPLAGSPPREAKPGCIDNQLHYRFPPNRLLHGLMEVRVAISAEGKPGAFQFPTGLPDDVVSAFTLSMQDCPYLPATGPGGQAVAGTFEHRVFYARPGDAERAAGTAPKQKREAKLSSPTCLQRLKPAGVIGHAVVEVTVTAEGEPTNFRLQPQNTPASIRLAIFDVLAACKWEPAIGLDDKPVAGETSVTIRYR
jgi:hypothetical protein